MGVTGDAAALVESARAGGAEAQFFAGPEEAGAAVAAVARPGDLVLFKGSRGTRMELAVERYRAG